MVESEGLVAIDANRGIEEQQMEVRERVTKLFGERGIGPMASELVGDSVDEPATVQRSRTTTRRRCGAYSKSCQSRGSRTARTRAGKGSSSSTDTGCPT